MEEENKKNSKKGLVITLAIVTAIVIGVVVFIVAGGDKLFNKNNEKNDKSASDVVEEEDTSSSSKSKKSSKKNNTDSKKSSKKSSKKDDEEEESKQDSSKNKNKKTEEEKKDEESSNKKSSNENNDKKSEENKADDKDEESEKTNSKSGEISNKIESKEFILDGVAYNLNSNVSEFIDNGWKINYEYHDSDKIAAKTKSYTSWNLNKESFPKYGTLSITVANESDEEMKVDQCSIYKLVIACYQADKYGDMNFELPGGVKFGTNKEKIKELYGAPTTESENSISYYLDEVNLYIALDKDGNLNYVSYYLR